MLGATGCGPHLGANIFKRRNKARPINLALQGGGVHGAFTWGVLERLLADDTLSFGWISGTSAGAINAVAVAHGLAHGGKEAAVSALENLWHAVIAAQVPDFIKLNPFMAGLVRAAGVSHSQMGAMFSPYEFNPARVDPLRTLLEQQIDFEAIRAKQPCELIIAATDIATGRARLFGTADLTVDAVLASACLPMLHHAVTIDGRSYWDGGFSANPDLLTIATQSPVSDTLLVQLNPTEHRASAPIARRHLRPRSNDCIQQPLLRDLEAIVQAQQKNGKATRPAPIGAPSAKLRKHRFHVIEAGRHTADLALHTKVHADKDIVAYLHDAGYVETTRWLEQEGVRVGKAGVDLAKRYFFRVVAQFRMRRLRMGQGASFLLTVRPQYIRKRKASVRLPRAIATQSKQ